MISAVEMAIMSRQTDAFVAADAETITVTPKPTRTADGAGGYTLTDGAPFDLTVRLIPQSDKVPVTDTWEGTRPRTEYILIGNPDLALQLSKDDVFAWRGAEWKISQVHDKPDYEFKADVIRNVG